MKLVFNIIILLCLVFACQAQADLKKVDLGNNAPPKARKANLPKKKPKIVHAPKKNKTPKAEMKKYDEVGAFSGGLAKVELNHKFGYINEAKKEIIPCEFDQIGKFYQGFTIVKKGNKYGVYDKKGLVYPCIYDNANFINKIHVVEKNRNWITIDKSGIETIVKKSLAQ